MKPANAASLFVAICLCACTSSQKSNQPRRVERQHEAGSVHIAVLSVAPWEEYVEALQPMFELSEENALNMVVPTTRTLETLVIDSLRSMTRAAYMEEGGSIGSSEVRVESQPRESEEGRRLRAEEQKKIAESGMDPLMKYWAAAALFQEVQLLNRYVKDAAVREGFKPYVARVQVSLMPIARNEPYDAYCTMSFFSKAPVETDEERLMAKTRTGPPEVPLRGDDDPIAAALNRQTPQIIPLMVTDNLEATLQNRMIENTRQLAGAIFFMCTQLAGTSSVDWFSREFQSIFGRDLNSLLTVGRVSDNTLRVRLGAMQQGASTYSMIPRTHSITVLLMVPEGVPSTLEVVSRTTLVDAETGETLPDRPQVELEAQVKEVLENYGLEGTDSRILWNLLAHAQANDQRLFFKELRSVLGEDHPVLVYERALWVDLVTLMVGSQYGATEFDLPRKGVDSGGRRAELFLPQTALVVDDGKEQAVAILKRGRIAKGTDITAFLHVVHGEKEFSLLADEIQVDPATGDVLALFPSLQAWGLGESAQKVGSLCLSIDCEGKVIEFNALYIVKK